MQFRPVGSRVQCHAAWYDSATKRGRQKLVYSIIVFGVITKKPTADNLKPGFGTREQREKWAAEIGDEIDRLNAVRRQGAIERLPGNLADAAKRLAAEIGELTDDQRAKCKAAIVAAAEVLGLLVYDQNDVKKPRARRPAGAAAAPGAPGEDPRAFGAELIDRAKTLRAEGLSIAATADRMKSEGHEVSKSWVQKWTA